MREKEKLNKKNFIKVKQGRKVVGFKPFPTFEPNGEDINLYEKEMRSKISVSAQISHEAYDYSRYSFEFKAAEISKNKKTIIEEENIIIPYTHKNQKLFVLTYMNILLVPVLTMHLPTLSYFDYIHMNYIFQH